MGSRFKVLGRTQLLIADHFDGAWASPKVRGILGALLLRPNQAVPIEELIHWVWPEDAEPPKASTFHTYATRIREALGRMASPPKLVPERGAYRLEVAPEDVDFFEFLSLFNHGRQLGQQSDHAGACATLLSALDIWLDRPLVDLDGDRAQNWRTAAMDEYWLPAQNELMRELAALGEFGDVLRRIDGLPPEYLTDLLMVKRRLEALYGVHRDRYATDYFLRMRKRMIANDDQGAADELTRFHQTLLRRAEHPRAQDLARDTTPADPAPRVPRLLPREISDLLGRDQLLAELDAMMMTSAGLPMNRVVCVEGPPGIGKTALVVRWGHRAADHFPGGQLFADLNGVAEGRRVESAAVVDRFLAELEFPLERIPTAEGRASKLRSLLAGRRALVVLDNVANTDHVLGLVDCLPCSIVVTSRRRLSGLSRRGAEHLPVPPLSYSDTATWLANRLGARALTEPDHVTALASACRGHALTLHVVTQYVVGRPRLRLAEFVEELRDTHALLELGEDSDNPGGSVQAAFTTSYQALDAAERKLFALLGAHPGPDISVDAASSLTGLDVRTARRLLDGLVDTHLLTQPEERGRYRFHDLLRVFAGECVAAEEYNEERPAAEQRMLNFYHHGAHNADMILFPERTGLPVPPLLDGVIEVTFSEESSAISWCARERVNLNAAIHFAGINGFHEYATQMASSTGEAFHRLGYYQDVVAALQVALESAATAGNKHGLAYSNNNMGFTLLNHREFDSARSYLTTARQLYDEVGDNIGSAVANYNLARIRVEQGDYRRGIEGLHASLEVFRNAEATGAELNVICRLAEAHRRVNAIDEAISFARDGLWLAVKLNDELNQAICLTELASAYYEAGDLPSAKGYAERALAINARLSGLAAAGRTSAVLAAIHRDLDDLPTAERHARAAVNFCRNGRDLRTQALANNILGDILHEQARQDEALQSWSISLAILMDLGDPMAESVRSQIAELSAALPIVTPEQTRPLMNVRHRRTTPPGV